MWRRAKRIGFWLAGVTLLAAAGVLMLVQTSVFQQWLLGQAERLAAESGHPFTARKLDIDIWRLRASLEAIVYDDNNGTRVAVDQLITEIPWDIFKQSIIRIRSVEATGVSIEIHPGPPLAVVPGPVAGPMEAPPILIDQLVIRKASLTYSNQNTTFRIPAFDVEVHNGRGALRLASPVTISPDTRVSLAELGLETSAFSVEFTSSAWRLERADITVNGSSRGRLRWSPSLAVTLDYSLEPFSFQQWRGLASSGTVAYEDGVLKLTNFRAQSGAGEVTGTAAISDDSKSADMVWRAVNLAPAGLPALTDGNVHLEWKTSDFSDLSGKGSILVNSRQYGRAQSDITFKGARADLDIRANAFDAVLRARVTTGFDRKISGTFQATHTRYGRARLVGSLGGSFTDPHADAMLIADNIAYQNFGPASVSAHASLNLQTVSLEDIHILLKNSSASGGFLRLNLAKPDLAGEIPDIQVQLQDFIPNASGNVNLSATVQGTINAPAAHVVGSSQGLDIGGAHIDAVQFLGDLTAGEFHLIELTARQGEGVLNASGDYNLMTEAIAGKAEISNLQLVQIPDLSTTVSVEAGLQGTIRSPSVNFSGRLRDVVYQGQEHGNLDLGGTADKDRITVRVQSEKYAAAAAAEIGLQEPYAFTASVTANRSRLQYQQYDITANGTVESSGQIRPFKAEQLSFSDFSINGEGVHLAASGSLSSGAAVNGTIELAELPVEGVALNGQARVQAVVSGSIEDPRVEGTVETSGATLETSGMGEPARIDAALEFTRNEFTVRRLRALFQGASADITGKGTLQGAGQFQFRAADIKPEQFLKDRQIMGVVSLEGQVDVTGPSLDRVRGSVKVTQLEVNVHDVAIHQVQPIEVEFQNQIASIRNFRIEGLDTRVTISGNTDLRTRELNLSVDADTDMKLLEAALPGSHPQGQIRTNLTVRGTPDQPALEGFVNGTRMQLQIAEPPISITEANAEIQLRGDRIQIAAARGNINGGEFTVSGEAGISPAGITDVAIQLNLVRAQTEYPEGFQSEISSGLALSGSTGNLEITGNVDVLSGAYQRDIDLTREVFSRISAEQAEASLTAASGERSAIDDIRLNIEVDTSGAVSVTNNLANFDLDGSFRVRGTLGNPIITGRAMVTEGGELYFGPRIGDSASTDLERRDRYVISEGTIELTNPIRTEPVFNIAATREVTAKDEEGNDTRYVITLHASGTLENPKTELTSDPYLDQPEIVAILLTGRRFNQLQGSELSIAREQFASYLSGRFSGAFSTAGSTFGLDTVQIDPVLLANEEDLSAKLTIGKNVTRDFGMIYSQNLSGARAQTWIANYQAIKNLLIRGVNRSEDNTLTVELRHDLKWGGGPVVPGRARAKDEEILDEVTFEGTTVPAKDLLKQVTKPGKPFSPYRLNEDARRLEQYFAGRSFLDAKVRAERNPRDGKVSVRFVIEEGPKITFAFQGAKVPGNIQQDIRQIWIRGFAEETSLRNSRDRLLRYFRDEGHLEAAVASRDESSSPSERRFVFDISPGRGFQTPEWVFHGIEPMNLNVRAGTTLENPRAIKRLIENELQRDGYLDAVSTEPELILEGTKARFEVTVERGNRYSIGKLDFDGARPEMVATISEGLIAEASPGGPSNFFTSSWLETTRQTIISRYWENGYNDVQIEAATHVRQGASLVDVQFKIGEGERQIINEIHIEGYSSTSLSTIRRQFAFKEGDPLDYSRVNLTRKNLYDTRLFRRVDLNVVKGNNGYTAETKLNENPPWNFRYGFAVTNHLQTSDRELGLTTDISYSNLLGKGITTGASMKYTRQEREARTFGSIPVFAGKNATTTLTLVRRRDLTIPESTTDLWGLTLQQQWRLRNRYILSYDYSYKRNHTFSTNPDPDQPIAFDLIVPIARFNGTLTRDTRDDILNAGRGTFLSDSFEIAPPGVGSSIQFLKNYTQYLRFRQLKPGLVWASAARVGFAHAFGEQELIPTEKFYAGGGTTVRAFQQDQLTLSPGNALFILNQELRFPLLWRFSGVTFFDAGNVYAAARDFNPFRLRYSPGVGIRIATPLVLVRFDLGLNMFRRPDERRSRFSFGVGQAF